MGMPHMGLSEHGDVADNEIGDQPIKKGSEIAFTGSESVIGIAKVETPTLLEPDGWAESQQTHAGKTIPATYN
ncbi:hypothetical protein Trydic_g6715 [Trypoxylus dichotomus]